MANRWWASVREIKPRWRNGCLEGGLVHCQILVLSGKGPQGIKEKGTGEKESWEKEDWSGVPQRAPSLMVEARFMLCLSITGA